MCSILHLSLTSLVGSVAIKTEIPPQNLRLKTVRIEFDTDANAQANPLIHVKLPFFGASSQINSENIQGSGYPIFTNGTAYTLYTPDTCVATHQKVHETFNYSISMTNTTGFEKIDLIFEYDISALS